jgi:hemoglobin
MAITDAQFGFVIADLIAALDTLGVPYTPGTFDGGLPADELIVILADMQTDIVTDPDGSRVAFNQIGGYAAVQAVVAEFVVVVGLDARINGYFAKTDLVALEALLVEQACEATGGYCTYTGRSMCDAHAGLGITPGAFGALVDDLLVALDNLGVPYALDGSQPIDALVLALADLEGQIVAPQVDCR